MRLGQLARKLELRPIEIVEFLAVHNIQIEEGTNTRLEGDHVSLIMRQFAPATTKAETLVEARSDNEKDNGVADPFSLETGSTEIDNKPEGLDGEGSSGKDNAAIIKATKVALSGLKVLGKIDLPEVRKKEIQPEFVKDNPTAPEVRKSPPQEIRRTHDRNKQRTDQRPEKNPIAIQREREAKEAQKKRQLQADREKEKRTQNYLKRVKMSPPTKPLKLVKEPVIEMSEQELAESPKTWLGQFIKWLTT